MSLPLHPLELILRVHPQQLFRFWLSAAVAVAGSVEPMPLLVAALAVAAVVVRRGINRYL